MAMAKRQRDRKQRSEAAAGGEQGSAGIGARRELTTQEHQRLANLVIQR